MGVLAEEFLYLGFVASVLRSRSTAAAFWGSVLVRVAVHLYQGPLALVAVAPVGVVLTSYYLGSRRIWPAVVAHAVLDFQALRQLVA
jgi:membrane protease YdiL (CAAX protease family)